MKKTAYFFLILFFVSSLAGCGKGPAPAKKPMAEKVKPGEVQEQQKETTEKKVQLEEYNYDAGGRRDPFLSLVEITRHKPMKRHGASPFESYDIDEIKLLAIAWDKNKHYALIMLPDKKAYTITEGTTLGLQGGKVIKITQDTVLIREYVKDYRGEIKPRDAILKLHKGEEE